jgi:hypothetical protein
VTIAADGTMHIAQPAVPGAPAPGRSTTAPAARNLRALYIILGIAGAGGVTGAVLALSKKSSNPPLSPATP